MRAAVFLGRGVVRTEVEKPIPRDEELLVRVEAASINAPDWRLAFAPPIFRRLMLSMSKRKLTGPGTDVAGVVEAAGQSATAFQPGDAVFGAAPNAFADYVCAPATSFAAKPDRLSFEEASCIAASGLTALQAVRDHAKLQGGESVLINGATGSVGTFTVQIAKAFGGNVTAVCSSRNVDLVRSLGADRVFAYDRDDFVVAGGKYDAIIDNVGSRPLLAMRRLLTDNGRLVLVGGPKQAARIAVRVIGAFTLSRFDKRLKMFIARLSKDDLLTIAELITSGKVRPVIDRVYSLDEVAAALRYVNEGHPRAKVVIKVREMVGATG